MARTVNDFIVKVNGSPEIIIQTINDNGVFIANENVAFSAEISPFKYEFDCSIPVSNSQFLPDGNGVRISLVLQLNVLMILKF